MKTRIILDIETSKLDKDILNKVGLKVVKELTKAKASLLSIKTEELKEEDTYIDLSDYSLLNARHKVKTYPSYNTINNGFIDDCIEILRDRRKA